MTADNEKLLREAEEYVTEMSRPEEQYPDHLPPLQLILRLVAALRESQGERLHDTGARATKVMMPDG